MWKPGCPYPSEAPASGTSPSDEVPRCSKHKQLAGANTGHEKTALQRQIDATDRQIDQLVYELYGLTDEEIALVEAATGPRK
jgi:hypothetical protein